MLMMGYETYDNWSSFGIFLYFFVSGLFKQGAPVAKIEQVHSMKTSNFFVALGIQKIHIPAFIFVRGVKEEHT